MKFIKAKKDITRIVGVKPATNLGQKTNFAINRIAESATEQTSPIIPVNR
jgi:hypothetical protein